MADSLYLETTVVSYYSAWPSSDIIVRAHQEITLQWWKQRIDQYDVFVSELVIEEAAQGDQNAAKKRLEVIQAFPVLEITRDAERLAGDYLAEIPILKAALRDGIHLAVASLAGLDYLLTWNCTHIARGEVRKALERINERRGIATPTICTPEELLGD